MTTKHLKNSPNSMHISSEKLAQFIELFERKTGRKLSDPEALEQAGTLLRTISILYKPASTRDYYSALAKKMFLKIKRA